MLLTTQRVRGTGGGGVNVLLYRHEPDRPLRWKDPASVIELDPGVLASVSIELPPGGNDVLSYLDIVALESLSKERIIDLVYGLEPAVLREGHAARDGLGCRFWSADTGTRAQREFRELRHRALALLARPVLLPWREGPGITIQQKAGADGLVFELTPQSTAVLRRTLGPNWRPPTVAVEANTLADLQAAGFDVLAQLATVMTGYRLAELVELGRVRVVSEHGNTLWEWPEPVGGAGYCLTCHRQHTLVAEDGHYRCSNCNAEQDNDGRFVAALS